MDPTTLSDLLSVKLNPCYLNEGLMSDSFIESAKTATRRTQEHAPSE